MRTWILIAMMGWSLQGAAQTEFLSMGTNSQLLLANTQNCEARNLGTYGWYIDIAVTPNGTIYGL